MIHKHVKPFLDQLGTAGSTRIPDCKLEICQNPAKHADYDSLRRVSQVRQQEIQAKIKGDRFEKKHRNEQDTHLSWRRVHCYDSSRRVTTFQLVPNPVSGTA